MTLERLQHIVVKLANQAPTRYWVWWNYPLVETEMAIYIEGGIDSQTLLTEMEGRGFKYDATFRVWTIHRTNEDGTPWVTKI